MKHKHYDLIIAWANDPSITLQYRASNEECWNDTKEPAFVKHWEYRIKPKPPVVRYMRVSLDQTYFQHEIEADVDNIKLTFDGESGSLLSVEKL